MTIGLLAQVARADHLGRETPQAIDGVFPAGERFLAGARAALVEKQAPRDVVMGRHLIARGMHPGPEFAAILDRCREIQFETGCDDPEKIMNQVPELA